jgi:glycosyltransferase involved in cell wall biosynthesis
VTKVLVWPADDDACAAYRLKLPAAAVAATGALEVEVSTRGPVVMWGGEWTTPQPPLDWPILGVYKPDADVIVMQRPARWHWARLIPFLQAHGIKVVVDVDDNFDAIERTHHSARAYDPKRDRAFNRLWVHEACKVADVVTVTTPALCRHYGYGHGVVIPNRVPEAYLKIEPEERRRAVGWSGWVSTHPGDLAATRGGVAKALAAHEGWGFHVIGSGEGVAAGLGLTEPPTSTGGWVPFDEYPHRLAELTIGVVPLQANPFNEAKSGLKLLEMSSLGVATVASPTPDNRRLAKLGLGIMAKSPADWRQRLGLLMDKPEVREEVAARSRDVAATQTVEEHVEDWIKAWSRR